MEFTLKNIFLVINKEKVYAYVVSVFTIVTLFLMSGFMNSKFIEESEEVSGNIISNTYTNNIIENNNINVTNNVVVDKKRLKNN